MDLQRSWKKEKRGQYAHRASWHRSPCAAAACSGGGKHGAAAGRAKIGCDVGVSSGWVTQTQHHACTKQEARGARVEDVPVARRAGPRVEATGGRAPHMWLLPFGGEPGREAELHRPLVAALDAVRAEDGALREDEAVVPEPHPDWRRGGPADEGGEGVGGQNKYPLKQH